MHLLQADVSNQTYSGPEDATNKPWRPLPSGRITVDQSRRLRWMLLIICLGVSVPYGAYVVGASTVLAWALVFYNDMDWSKDLVWKNVLNAIGYASFECGTTLIMGGLYSSLCVRSTKLMRSIPFRAGPADPPGNCL
jgi:4-hydroxybenzoate polyprenyltransferase